jgi:hypothetical protein
MVNAELGSNVAESKELLAPKEKKADGEECNSN